MARATPDETTLGPRLCKVQVFVDESTKRRINRRRGMGSNRKSESAVVYRLIVLGLDTEDQDTAPAERQSA